MEAGKQAEPLRACPCVPHLCAPMRTRRPRKMSTAFGVVGVASHHPRWHTAMNCARPVRVCVLLR